MADRFNDDFRSQVAFVTHTRDYRSADVLPSLARHGFTTTERPHDRETERLLAQFDHPALVKVFRFWAANGTAYMAMPLYEGGTLKQALRARGAPPDEAW
ncbi:MAG: hypothetical protein K6U88_14350, partial [Dehalococcoidia bacterium]|nr:hypothetical protein [Dehalococcoidia bacterium]